MQLNKIFMPRWCN